MMLNQTKESLITMDRFTGRNSKMLSIRGMRGNDNLVQLDARQFHATELFCRLNEEFRHIGRNDVILVRNCNKQLASEIRKWSGHRDALAHYCSKNQSIAVCR